ncbi:MAG: hypothetical protein DMG97_05945 [Acidobacteria bacterium]|nr:MAG: hypothetical protein DMG97_05945 [Acidobacteriota bacterium]
MQAISWSRHSKSVDTSEVFVYESGLAPRAAKLSEAEQANQKLVASLKAPADHELQSLRERSVQELLVVPGKQDPEAPSIGPIIDGWLISRSPAEVLSAGQEAPVDLLIGTTSREFGMPGPPDEVRKLFKT